LQRKGERGGFRVLAVRTSNQQDITGTIQRDQQKHPLKFASVQFDGTLQVTDPDLLREAVRQGIGSGKGLGFGLLSLARPQSL
jgi:CRISPR system Cascade subunit CasE